MHSLCILWTGHSVDFKRAEQNCTILEKLGLFLYGLPLFISFVYFTFQGKISIYLSDH